jgi:hypothetical protein
MAVNLPADIAARLVAEAARRGVSVDDLVAELIAAGLSDVPPPAEGDDPLEAFIGSGSSGRKEPFDLRQARQDLADQRRGEAVGTEGNLRNPDDLEAYIAERSEDDPELPVRIDAALRRRQMVRSLPDEPALESAPGTEES